MKNAIKQILDLWGVWLVFLIAGALGYWSYRVKTANPTVVTPIIIAENVCKTRGGIKALENRVTLQRMDLTCKDGTVFNGLENY